jgi:ethanolamine phosphate transferase 2 subunit G
LVSNSSANLFNVISKYSDTFTITLFGLLFKHFVCKLYMQQCNFCSNTYFWNTVWFMVLLSICVNVQLLKAVRIEDLKDNFSQLCDHVDSFLPLFLVFGTAFHTFSAASSSFIEEEHQTWYYLCNTVFVVLALMEVKQNFAGFERIHAIFNVKAPPALRNQTANKNAMEAFKTLHNLVIKWAFFFGVHVALRRLNQTGDKFLNIPDMGDWLVQPEKQIWLSVVLFLGLVLTLVVINDFTGVLSNVLSLTAAVLIYYYRTISGAVLLTSIKPSKYCPNVARFVKATVI